MEPSQPKEPQDQKSGKTRIFDKIDIDSWKPPADLFKAMDASLKGKKD
jgi:hypothetical protein